MSRARSRPDEAVTVARSDEVRWDTKTPDGFDLFSWEFDVREAKRIIVARPRRVVRVNVVEFRALSRFAVKLPLRRGTRIDPSVPLVVARVCMYAEDAKGREHESIAPLPIDGWHRLEEADRRGQETMGAVFLTQRETARVRR